MPQLCGEAVTPLVGSSTGTFGLAFLPDIELSWLPDAGFCHVNNADILTKNCVLLAFGIYTVTLWLNY